MAMFGKSRTLRGLLAEYEWELPTSFIDVVFLLLLYFTLTMKFQTLEQRLETFLPNRGGGHGPERCEQVTIRVSAQDPAGRVPRFQVNAWVTADPNELVGKLAQLPDSFRMVIDGAGRCPFRHVMAAADACLRAGKTKVEFQAPPAGP